MTLAGGHFYTSATFWGPAVGVIVGLLTIAATVWVTLRAANPKRRLYYSMAADTPLVTRPHDLSQGLKVIYGTRELDSPHVVIVQLTRRGGRDISREAFDDGKPMCLDLGTPIVECVKVTTSPSDCPEPSYAIDGSKLMIGPSHFGRHQTTVFSLLVDGDSPEIVEPPQTLVDVEIRQGDSQSPASGLILLLISGLYTVVLIAGCVVFVFFTRSQHLSVWFSVAFVTACVGMVIAFVYRLYRRERPDPRTTRPHS